jgi:hypothetical protein
MKTKQPLKEEVREAFNKAWEAYKKATDIALTVYEKAKASAREAYVKRLKEIEAMK